MSKRNDGKVTTTSAHGEAGSSKYSSNGNEREMRKELTHSEKSGAGGAHRDGHQTTSYVQQPQARYAGLRAAGGRVHNV